MKNILYKSILSLFITTFVVSCDDTETIELNNEGIPEVSLSENSILLSEANADENALTVFWTEPNYGFDAAPTSYKVLIDKIDGDFSAAQSSTASMPFEKTFTTQQLNTYLIALELAPNEESQVKLKVEVVLSAQKSVYSESISLSVTPYPALVDLSTTWGVVGDATPNSWDGPDVPFYKTDVDNVFATYVHLGDGFIKFRENNDWAVNYGDTGADGTLEGGGDDIPVTAGTYYISMNLNDLTYTITDASSENIWGLVGDSTPNGWDGPDWTLFPAGNDIYVTYVTLTDGFMKFRENNDWGVNYGDTGADGTLEGGGDDIPVTAGSYKITMDLFNETYTIESN